MTDRAADPHPYLAGLVLTGRKVVVVGGGHVAQRRVLGPARRRRRRDRRQPRGDARRIEGLAGELTLVLREFTESDLDGAWYVVAATDDPAVNARVVAAADARHTFCVRADDALGGTAWTPAVGHHGSVTRRGARQPGAAEVGGAARRHRHRAARRAPARPPTRTTAAPASSSSAAGRASPSWSPSRPATPSPSPTSSSPTGWLRASSSTSSGPDVELIDVAKLPRGRSASQQTINEVIVDRARAGKRVVRFKGGDNFVFGRGYEELLACAAADVPVTVVPGLSSAIAVPARVGIPVTHRGVAHEFTVISGHLPPGHPESLVDWDAVAGLRGTLVLLMAVDNAPAIAEALLDGGRAAATPVAVIVDGTMPTERTVLSTLGALADDLVAHRVARRRSSWSARSSPWRVRHTTGVADPVEISDPDDPRLADYRDLRDVELRKSLEAEHGLFLAEGEKVVRRAVEAGHEAGRS